MAPHVSTLPLEVLTDTLKYLSPKDMRAASNVSKTFHQASQDAGLTLDSTIQSFDSAPLATFRKIIKHAKASRLPCRLGLDIWLLYNIHGADGATDLPALNKILSAVRSAMPHLATLSIRVPSNLAAAVYAKLDKPAPRLRTLRLSHDETFLPRRVHIPAKLFKGDAPCLRNLTLTVPALLPEWAPVPALRNVRSLSVLRCNTAESLAIALFFPGVQYLELTLGRIPPTSLRHVDISGLTLRTLSVINDDDAPVSYAFSESAPRPKIATVNYKGNSLRFDPFLWPDTNSEVHAHIQCVFDADRQPWEPSGRPVALGDPLIPTGMAVAIVPTDRAHTWRRTYYALPVEAITHGVLALKLDALQGLSTRLVSLAVADALFEQLMRTSLALDVLRELFVDVTPAPGASSQKPSRGAVISNRRRQVNLLMQLPGAQQLPPKPTYPGQLRCSTLERITVFATAPLNVTCDRIASLGRLVRAAGARAELVLVRANVDLETERPALEELFVSIRTDIASPSSLPVYYHPREDDRIWNLPWL